MVINQHLEITFLQEFVFLFHVKFREGSTLLLL